MEEKSKKIVSWILRDKQFCSNKDENGFTDIDELLTKYYNFRIQQIKDNAYYCKYKFRAHEKSCYKKYLSIDELIRSTFTMYFVDISNERFLQLVDIFIEQHLFKYTLLNKEILYNIQTKYPIEFALDETNKKIRAIRSWEQNNKLQKKLKL
jgi:hypothetical protein